MNKYIIILRGINVGGHRKIIMADLKMLLEKEGFIEITTYIQSGNIALKSTMKSKAEIEDKIQQLIKKKYDYDVPTIALSEVDIISVIASNPYTNADPKEVHVTFFKSQPDSDLEHKLESINQSELGFAPDEFTIFDNFAYILCKKGYHKTKINNTFFEKKLNIASTTRNWKTTYKLFEMLA